MAVVVSLCAWVIRKQTSRMDPYHQLIIHPDVLLFRPYVH